MALDVNALRDSFTLVIERSPNMTHRFYEVMFERYPEFRPLFGRNSARRQEEMLTRALALVIEHLEDPAWLTDTLLSMGARHVDYGVADEMYPCVAECLVATLSEVAGDDWTPRYTDAWTEALGTIAGIMIEGSRRARAEAQAAVSR